MGLKLHLGDEEGPGPGTQASHKGGNGQEPAHGLIPRMQKWRNTWLLPSAKGRLTPFVPLGRTFLSFPVLDLLALLE